MVGKNKEGWESIGQRLRLKKGGMFTGRRMTKDAPAGALLVTGETSGSLAVLHILYNSRSETSYRSVSRSRTDQG